MSACAMLSYNGVTATAWSCIVKGAASYGATITSASGSDSVSGFTIEWSYDAAAGTLHIQCTDSPWWAPCSTINGKINDAIEACLGQEKIEMAGMVPN